MSQTQRHIKSQSTTTYEEPLCYYQTAYKCDLYSNGNYGN